ncbi:MAG: hypothetical protein RIA71_14830 [Oceanicaulis sp.]
MTRSLLLGAALVLAACNTETAPDAQPGESRSAASEAVSADAVFDAYLERDRALQNAWRDSDDQTLLAELAHRAERDQAVRQLIPELLETPGAGPNEATLTWFRVMRHMNAIDRDNARWLKAQLEDRVWFTPSQYGDEADSNAFLIVQHATHDRDLMRDVHQRFEELLPEGEVAPDHYALLSDRLAVMDGRSQPYGSQFECVNGEQRLQTPIAEPETVDARRADVGLPTMAQYRAALPDCGSMPGGG